MILQKSTLCGRFSMTYAVVVVAEVDVVVDVVLVELVVEVLDVDVVVDVAVVVDVVDVVDVDVVVVVTQTNNGDDITENVTQYVFD